MLHILVPHFAQIHAQKSNKKKGGGGLLNTAQSLNMFLSTSCSLLAISHIFTPIHSFVMNFRTPFSFLYPIQLNFLWFIFGVGKSSGLWWEYAVPAKNPWLHLPVFYTLLCSALWKRGLGLGMFLLTERKRKFQPEFIFHLSCMGFDKGCSLVLWDI